MDLNPRTVRYQVSDLYPLNLDTRLRWAYVDMQSLRTASQALLRLSSVSLERPPRFGVIDEPADVDQSERLSASLARDI